MRRLLLLMLLASAVWLAPRTIAVRAQQPSEALQFELKVARTPLVVHPLPDPRIVEKDIREAITEVEARARRDEVIRELMERRLRRPDLDRDVISGIQSRNLTDALRRRMMEPREAGAAPSAEARR